MRSGIAAAAGLAALLAPAPSPATVLHYLAVATGGRVLRTIDSATGADAAVMTLAGVTAGGLASAGTPGQLYAPREAPDELVLIDAVAMTFSSVGPTGVRLKELAWDATRGVLYGTDYASLYVVSTATGAATLVGSHGGPSEMWSLGFDARRDTLFGVDTSTDLLYTIDVATGRATAVGATGLGRISDIDSDASDGTLYAVNQDDNTLRTLDPATGRAGPAVAPLSASFALGLAAPPGPGGGCLVSALSVVGRLLGVETGPAAARFHWDPDPQAGAYHLNVVDDKLRIGQAYRSPRGSGLPACDAPAAAPTCEDTAATGPLLYYQVVSACGAGGNLEGPIGP